MKGMFYTLDGIIAALLLMVVVTLAFVFAQNLKAPPLAESNLGIIAQDSLAVLEKNQTFAQVMASSDTRALQLYLDALPSNVCATLTIYTRSWSTVTTVPRTGCVLSDAYPLAVVRRTFISDNRIVYITEMRTWYT